MTLRMMSEIECDFLDALHYSGVGPGQPTTMRIEFPVGRYRIDFLLTFTTPKGATSIAVEVDGHEWHERTKEQARHDKARDRAILAAGYPVVRFTGSEVYNDAIGCVNEAIEVLLSVYNRKFGNWK